MENRERDERTIHRLEAFSDIVIGFTLAEISVNLTMPRDPAALASLWPALNAFLFSFFLIAMLWWRHHQLFVTYFVLNKAAIVMNFVMLGALALAIYFQQVAVHFIAIGAMPDIPLQMWMACMALVYGLLAAMFGMGIWERRRELEADKTYWGVNHAYSTVIGAVVLFAESLTLPDSVRASVVACVAIVALSAARKPLVRRVVAIVTPPSKAA